MAPLVLVVDDQEDSREILAQLFTLAGYEVDVLPSGHRVVERAALLEPAVIVLDVVMPGLDGLEVARRLKADERTRRIPVIAYSGRAREAEVREAGFDDFLQKGTDPRELLHKLRETMLSAGRIDRGDSRIRPPFRVTLPWRGFGQPALGTA